MILGRRVCSFPWHLLSLQPQQAAHSAVYPASLPNTKRNAINQAKTNDAKMPLNEWNADADKMACVIVNIPRQMSLMRDGSSDLHLQTLHDSMELKG